MSFGNTHSPKIELLELSSSCCWHLLIIFPLILLVSFCKVGLWFDPFKFKWRPSAAKIQKIDVKMILFVFPLVLCTLSLYRVLVLCVWDTCRFDLLSNTVPLLRVQDQAKSRFHFTWTNVFFTVYITEVFWNAAALLPRSGVKQTSKLKADFSHCFWRSQQSHGCLTRGEDGFRVYEVKFINWQEQSLYIACSVKCLMHFGAFRSNNV